MTIPLLINCRDRCDTVIKLVEWAQRLPNVSTYLVDNASTFPPLIDFYRRTTAPVLFAGENGGPRTPWRYVAERLHDQPFYAITDCDLDFASVPTDIVDVCTLLLGENTELVKVGCALSLDGLPETHLARSREAAYWNEESKREPIVFGRRLLAYSAPIDTTFAVYRADGACGVYEPAWRLAGEYTARHRPWHYTPETLPDDESYYLAHLNPCGIFYSAQMKADLLSSDHATVPQ